jgi:hypothetical protein
MDRINGEFDISAPLKLNAEYVAKALDVKFNNNKELLGFVNNVLNSFGLQPVNEVSVLDLFEIKKVLEINDNSDIYSARIINVDGKLFAKIFVSSEKYKEKLILEIQGYPEKFLGPVLEKVGNLSSLSIRQLIMIRNLLEEKYLASQYK